MKRKSPIRHKTALLEKNMKVYFLQLSFTNVVSETIAERVSEGLFHILEDVSPQHVTTALDALRSVKNTSAKQLYTL